jgi:hypothetical protein
VSTLLSCGSGEKTSEQSNIFPAPAHSRANYQAKSEDEMQAVADALSLLANIVMAWNTTKMQAIFDRWAQRRSGAIPPELIARIAPTRTEGINMRGVFRFPIEQYADQLLPSLVLPKIHVLGQ